MNKNCCPICTKPMISIKDPQKNTEYLWQCRNCAVKEITEKVQIKEKEEYQAMAFDKQATTYNKLYGDNSEFEKEMAEKRKIMLSNAPP